MTLTLLYSWNSNAGFLSLSLCLIITSAKKVIFLSVCLFLSLFIFVKLVGGVWHGPRKKPIHYGGDPTHREDPPIIVSLSLSLRDHCMAEVYALRVPLQLNLKKQIILNKCQGREKKACRGSYHERPIRKLFTGRCMCVMHVRHYLNVLPVTVKLHTS